MPSVRPAFSWWARARGLLFGKPLAPDGSEALLLKPCASIHTFFMGYSLDLVFLDKHERVIRIHRHVKPWRVRAVAGAYCTLELRAGGVDRIGINIGERLRWVGR